MGSCPSCDDSQQITACDDRCSQPHTDPTITCEVQDTSLRGDHLPSVRVVVEHSNSHTPRMPPLPAIKPVIPPATVRPTDTDDGSTTHSQEPLATSRLSNSPAVYQPAQVSSTNSTRPRGASSKNCANESRSYSGSQVSTGKDPSLHPVLTQWSSSIEMNSARGDDLDVSAVSEHPR